MHSINPKSMPFFVIILSIYVFSWFIQSQLLLSWDVSWLMEVSARLMKGGSYTKNFFEINPPMILYLYTLPVIASKSMSLSLIFTLRTYIFAIGTLSLFISYCLTKKYFHEGDEFASQLLIIALAIAYFILPAYEFGQREHLIYMLIMPYFFLVAVRLQDKWVSPFFAFIIGLLGGLGFSIKPHFLVPLVLIELYYLFRTRRLFAWARIETLTMACVFLSYFAGVLMWHSDYLITVIPIVKRLYDIGFDFPWVVMFLQKDLLFIWLTLVLCCSQFEKNKYKSLNSVLGIAFISFLFIYFWQDRLWYYHLLPSLCIALLLATLSFLEIFRLYNQNKADTFFLIILAIFIFSPLLYLVSTKISWGQYYKTQMSEFISYLQKNVAHQSFFVFASTPSYAYSALDYTSSVVASRFAFPGWIPGMLRRHDAQAVADKQFFIDMTIEDFMIIRPGFVFVDVQQKKNHIDDDNFDYLNYLSQDNSFRQVWKSYHYITTIAKANTFKFAVYKMNEN